LAPPRMAFLFHCLQRGHAPQADLERSRAACCSPTSAYLTQRTHEKQPRVAVIGLVAADVADRIVLGERPSGRCNASSLPCSSHFHIPLPASALLLQLSRNASRALYIIRCRVNRAMSRERAFCGASPISESPHVRVSAFGQKRSRFIDIRAIYLGGYRNFRMFTFPPIHFNIIHLKQHTALIGMHAIHSLGGYVCAHLNFTQSWQDDSNSVFK
jgi:hypothetical protein